MHRFRRVFPFQCVLPPSLAEGQYGIVGFDASGGKQGDPAFFREHLQREAARMFFLKTVVGISGNGQ